jgi:NADPH:quinone reductase-like Zn-dependent oxidoreductase
VKAIKYSQYGPPDVLKLVELEKPAPKSNELLVKVRAVSINYGDMIARNFKNISSREFNMPFLFWFLARIAFGLNAPRNGVLGSEFAGEVEAVGGDVKTFKAGDPVFGFRGQSMGANAEYLCVPEHSMVTAKPANMTYDEAAAVPYGALTALSLLRKVKIQPGQKVLINGASGSIGAAAVQLAKHFGATVTGVCSTRRLAYVKSLGADKVIDYTREDFTRSGETYDLIFDVLGRSSFEKCKSSLNENGPYLLASFKGRQLLQMLLTRNSSKKVICALSGETLDDLLFIKTLIESSELKTIIDRRFPLDKTADAHRYMEAGEKRGCVIITIG